MSVSNEILNATFDYATSRPTFTVYELADDLGISYGTAKKAIRALRITLGSDDVTLVCNPDGLRKPWLYQLVGNYPESKPYLVNRTGDMRARLTTALSIATPIANHADRRTREGKQANLVKKVIGRLIEDLDELEMETSS